MQIGSSVPLFSRFLFAKQKWRHRHREQTYGHGVGEEGEMDEWRQWHGNIYTTLCKIDSQWEFAV